MDEAGADYAVLAESEEVEGFAPAFDTLHDILQRSPTPMTREQIRQAWPLHLPPPPGNTLWRWLSRGCALGLFARSGAGTRVEPFRYALTQPQEDAA
jgi:hypothetical protein